VVVARCPICLKTAESEYSSALRLHRGCTGDGLMAWTDAREGLGALGEFGT